jgi:hypothetical protein
MGGFFALLAYLIPNNTKRKQKSVVDSIASAINMNYQKACRPLIRAKQAFQ